MRLLKLDIALREADWYHGRCCDGWHGDRATTKVMASDHRARDLVRRPRDSDAVVFLVENTFPSKTARKSTSGDISTVHNWLARSMRGTLVSSGPALALALLRRRQ